MLSPHTSDSPTLYLQMILWFSILFSFPGEIVVTKVLFINLKTEGRIIIHVSLVSVQESPVILSIRDILENKLSYIQIQDSCKYELIVVVTGCTRPVNTQAQFTS